MNLAIRAENLKRFKILRFVGESTTQVDPWVCKNFEKNLEFAIWAEHSADVFVLAPCAPLARASMNVVAPTERARRYRAFTRVPR